MSYKCINEHSYIEADTRFTTGVFTIFCTKCGDIVEKAEGYEEQSEKEVSGLV